MSPRTHVAHYRHPALALVQQISHGMEIGGGAHHVRKQFHLETSFCDESANEQIIRRAVFDRLETAEALNARPSGHDGLAEAEFHAVQEPSDEDTRIKIAHHTELLKLFGEVGLRGGGVKACHAANFWVLKRSHDGTQVVGCYAD